MKINHFKLPFVFCTLLNFASVFCDDGDGDIVEEGKCDENSFSKPYCILREKRDGADLKKMDSPGLMDLSTVMKSFLCVNGAVIIYKNSTTFKSKHDDNGDKEGLEFKHVVEVPDGKSIRFTNGSLKILSHTCIPVNWHADSDHSSRIAGIFFLSSPSNDSSGNSSDKSSPQSGPSNSDNSSDSSSNSNSTDSNSGSASAASNGNGSKSEFPPIKVLLNQKDLGYKIGQGEGIVMDVSFVLSGTGPWCLEMPDNHKIHITSSHASNPNMVCKWSPSEKDREDKHYKRFFHKGLHISNYKWVECPKGNETDEISPCHNNTHPTEDVVKNDTYSESFYDNGTDYSEEQVPCNDGIIRHKPFATYESPAGLASAGKKFLGRKSNHDHKNSTPKFSSEEVFKDDGKSKNKRKRYDIVLKDCIKLPRYDGNLPECNFLNSNDSQSCSKLSAALEFPEEQSSEGAGGGGSSSKWHSVTKFLQGRFPTYS